MARHEADREDLFSELATASPRWELQVAGFSAPIVTGLRPGRVWSLYFEADRCYHFDADGGLRRAYLNGALYRSEGTTLARLLKERTNQQTVIRRSDLQPTELDQFIAALHESLRQLLLSLQQNNVTITRDFPAGSEVSVLIDRCEEVLQRQHPLSPPLK